MTQKKESPLIESTLAQRIEQSMLKIGLSQTELAARAGTTKSSVSNWMRGKSQTMRSATLMKMSRALQVDPTWLSTGKGSPDNYNPEMPEEAELFMQVYNAASFEQREMLMLMVNSLSDHLAGTDAEPVSESVEDAPGAALLAESFQILEHPSLKGKVNALTPDLKGEILAITAKKVQEAKDGGDAQNADKLVAFVENVVDFMGMRSSL